MISNHDKFFQDVYLKVGAFEISRSSQEKSVAAVKRALNYFPSLINWNIGCPDHVKILKNEYVNHQFSSNSQVPL